MDLDSAVKVQLFGLCFLSHSAAVSKIGISEGSLDDNEEAGACNDNSEFIELLDAPQVPFISTSKNPPQSGILGQGGFSGISYDANANIEEHGTPAIVAIKEFKSSPSETTESLRNLPKAVLSQAFIEVCVMRHPVLSTQSNILRLLGITEADAKVGFQSLTAPRIALVTEYADFGNLDSYLRRHVDLSWCDKRQILHNIAEGLQALHACDIVRRMESRE